MALPQEIHPKFPMVVQEQRVLQMQQLAAENQLQTRTQIHAALCE
jgi:hypothetical protein